MRISDQTYLNQQAACRLLPNDTFQFRCHSEIGCFNRCCQNLNLFLYPYDVLRLKKALNISSDAFLDAYTDVVLRQGDHFPEVLLRMKNDAPKSCSFLTDRGCSVYAHRPDTCRTFPVEQGVIFDADQQTHQKVFFFRPPEFCLGPSETTTWTPESWLLDQESDIYRRMTLRWGELRRLLEDYPWGPEGTQGRKGKMVFMSAYNLDRLREFIFQSSFLKRYRVSPRQIKALRKDDEELLLFGFEWIELFLYGKPGKRLRGPGR